MEQHYMRKRISERNILPGTRLFDEYKKLELLFSEKICIGMFGPYANKLSPSFTLEQYLNEVAFSGWSLRGSAISFYNMRDELGLSKEQITNKFDTDIFIDFIELCLNCVLRIESTIDNYSGMIYLSDKNLTETIVDNCKSILESLNYAFNRDEKTNEIFVYTENQVATAVAERNKDIEYSLIEYRRHDMKGDLKRKGEILCTLYKKLEPIEDMLKGTTYKNLASDTFFLFNTTGARHWVEQDKIASKSFMEMDSDTLEKWYDNTYDLFLSCMVISSYLDIKKEIEKIKKI